MLAYPIMLEDDDGSVLVTSPDFPELTTFGEDRDEAVARAADALEEAIAARIHDGNDIPQPSPGNVFASLPTLTVVKVRRYQAPTQPAITIIPQSHKSQFRQPLRHSPRLYH